jgi:hypothetical protein
MDAGLNHPPSLGFPIPLPSGFMPSILLAIFIHIVVVIISGGRGGGVRTPVDRLLEIVRVQLSLWSQLDSWGDCC